MRKVLMLVIAMVFSSQAFAESQMRKAHRLTNELATINAQLDLAKAERNSQITKIAISTTAAVALGIVSLHRMQIKSADMSGPFNKIYGVTGLIVTAGIVGYDGYQVYQLTVSNKAIPALQKSISDKQAELDLILKADDEAQKALTEINN